MKLIFLGAGSGLVRDAKNFQSNMVLITDTGKKLLIDCGTDIRFSLTQANYVPDEIDAVYISHLHADHIGGMEWFALQRKFASQNGSPKLIIHEELAPLLWNNCLSGGLRTLGDKEADLSDYFQVNTVNAHAYEWEGLQLNLIKTVHVYSNKKLMPSYGLNIRYQGKAFLITADTQFTPEIFKNYYRDATLIFQDCETKKLPSGVHAHFSELDTLDPEIKAKMWLYHYNDGKLFDARTLGFAGFAQCGQIFDL